MNTNRVEAIVGGRPMPAQEHLDVMDKFTGEVIATMAMCDGTHVDAAVRAARRALGAWSRTPRAVRAEHLARLLEELRRRRDDLIRTTVAEVGAPVVVATEGHIDLSLEILESYVDLLRQPERVEEVGNSLIVREPVGVVGAITPWNYPLYQLVIKVAGALAAGCTVVAKPAELTPVTAHLLLQAAADAGLPDGVLNLVPGAGGVVGEAIASHPGIDLVSFTGSTRIGSRVAELAAPNLTRVSLELGGKSASLVLPGADLHTAVRATVDSATYNTGQTCSAWTRLLVSEQQYAEALQIARNRLDELVVGDPTEPDTEIGPLISTTQATVVTGFIDRARQAGAEVHSWPGALPTLGNYVAPTLVWDVGRDAEIALEEVFGPVLVVQTYTDIDDAVALANSTSYGLAGAVWAESEEAALQAARRMRTGQVDLNGATFNVRAPFGGYGRSGYGRELGLHGMEEFTEVKSIQR